MRIPIRIKNSASQYKDEFKHRFDPKVHDLIERNFDSWSLGDLLDFAAHKLYIDSESIWLALDKKGLSSSSPEAKEFAVKKILAKTRKINAAKPSGKKFPDRATMIKKLVAADLDGQRDEKFTDNIDFLEGFVSKSRLRDLEESGNRSDVMEEIKRALQKDYSQMSDKNLQENYANYFDLTD